MNRRVREYDKVIFSGSFATNATTAVTSGAVVELLQYEGRKVVQIDFCIETQNTVQLLRSFYCRIDSTAFQYKTSPNSIAWNGNGVGLTGAPRNFEEMIRVYDTYLRTQCEAILSGQTRFEFNFTTLWSAAPNLDLLYKIIFYIE